MRDIALALALLVLTPWAVKRPWIGVMGWVWVSLMVPHMQTFGFMIGKPVAMLIGGATLLGVVMSKDPRHLPLTPPTLLLIVFTLWMCVTSAFALSPGADVTDQLIKVLKINLMTLVAILVLHTRRQVDILIATVALSVAFFGVKGGLFTLTSGGEFRVRGAGGFLHGNNEIGLGLVMTVPLLYYLIIISPNRWLTRALWGAVGLTTIAAVGTQSRGAFLGIIAMGTAFVLRSPKPGRLILPIVVLTIGIAMFMPDSWYERMASITEYQSDESALGRLNAWTLAFNVATANIFGGGFDLETPTIFARYAPNPAFIAVAHSIYFQVLGHHGFIGLALYLAFWLSVFATSRWVARHAQSPEDVALARMIEISLIGFATGGAFLNLAYFDGPYYLMAALVVMRWKIMPATLKAARQAARAQQAAAPAPPSPPSPPQRLPKTFR